MVVFAYRQNYMYWTDVEENAIKRAKLNGSEVTTIVSEGVTIAGKSLIDSVCCPEFETSLCTAENKSGLARSFWFTPFNIMCFMKPSEIDRPLFPQME